MFVPWPFQHRATFHIVRVIYVHPSAISNDTGATFYIVPGSYMFVPGLFKMTLDYIPYGPCVIYVCPSAI
jgi:hypothetical protein